MYWFQSRELRYNGTTDAGHLTCEEPNVVLDPIAWFCGNGGSEAQPVKGKAANPLGLHDMLGSVGEWVWDWHGAYPTGDATDPTGPAEGQQRVARGGSYLSGARAIRAAYRYYLAAPGERVQYIGFRPARTIGN